MLVALENQCLTEREQEIMDEVNRDLYPHAIDTIVNRVTFDNAHTRTETAQTIIKALLVIGPITHALEHFLSGIGKVLRQRRTTSCRKQRNCSLYVVQGLRGVNSQKISYLDSGIHRRDIRRVSSRTVA